MFNKTILCMVVLIVVIITSYDNLYQLSKLRNYKSKTSLIIGSDSVDVVVIA